MSNRRGRKTAPGFGDPEQLLALERAFASLGDPLELPEGVPTQRPEADVDSGVPVAAAHSTTPSMPPRVSARRPSRAPRPRSERPPSRVPAPPASEARKPPLDVEVSYAAGPAPKADPRFLELWTQNTVYELDGHMNCIAVRSATSGEPHVDHPFLGHRLVGGQLKTDKGMELSYPLPRPGAAAVFEEGQDKKKRRFTRTSAVVRIVVRMNVARVTNDALLNTWQDLSKGSL